MEYERLKATAEEHHGDKDKEDIRRGIIGADDAGGRQKLLRTIRSGKYKYPKVYIIVTLPYAAELKLSNLIDFIVVTLKLWRRYKNER
ncbi:hypothetical protein DBV15_00115 [Temnothorax longispinosus]|uniref:Uncharacterized protein n=1 Tax=Temnothorax longispinosus TaxID=300112 RepID=A0A4S2KDC9_9HYME|nr:hypothetical protein DBV15_00115 [Temnothorax longispinosus]